MLHWGALAVLFHAPLAVGAESPVVLLESVRGPVPSEPSGWSVVGQTAPDDRLELTFAVKQQGVQELHDALMCVSTPSSLCYGQHWSNEQVQRLTAPLPEHVEAVMSFLAVHGVHGCPATPNSDMIVATVPVDVAERMLATDYVNVRHTSGAVVRRALGNYSLPASVAEAVDFVSPTLHLPGVMRSVEAHGAVFGYNTPENLRELYNITTEGKAVANKQAVTAFMNQTYSFDALSTFWNDQCESLTCGKGSPKLVGDVTAGVPKTEAMLDIEIITSVAGNIESEFWGYGGSSVDNVDNEPFMKWLAQVSSTSDEDVPKIFSTSYGEDESSWSQDAAQRLNVEFMKAGIRGISLLFASGDAGTNCKNGTFVPEGPGSSPYVTSVGGTTPASSWPCPGGETAIGLSSGGFSNYWAMPDYQKSAVGKYLRQDGLPDPSRGYNGSGRAYPDISAQASNFIVVTDQTLRGVYGTSCAAPTAAGIFALLNDLRLQNNQPTLGFLNPLIYENAAAFNDITTGSSWSCGEKGWPATSGWDAVTGLGTPNYGHLAQVVMQRPPASDASVLV